MANNKIYGNSIKHLWNLDSNIVFLNNGSFGAAPKKVLEAQRWYSDFMEKNPVSFIIEHSRNLLNIANSKLSNLVKAKPDNLAFVENATTAVNSVLHYLIFQKKMSGEILYTNHTYPAVVNALKYYEKFSDITLKLVSIPYPANDDIILDTFTESISDKTIIALIDSISSSTALVFPIDKLSELFASHNIISVVDGAHGVGCTELDLSAAKFDFYTSNNHKWLYAPKGSAFLYVNDKYLNDIHPLSISLFYGMGFRAEFEWQGTKDLTAWIATADAVDFYHEMGGIEILEYNRTLNCQAKDLILKNFATYSCDDMMNTVMSTYFLSDKIKISHDTTMELRKYFYDNYKIEIPFMAFDDKIWFRIACQIFNDLSDYKTLVDALNDFNQTGIKTFIK